MLEDNKSNEQPDENEDSSDRKDFNANADSDDIMVRRYNNKIFSLLLINFRDICMYDFIRSLYIQFKNTIC